MYFWFGVLSSVFRMTYCSLLFVLQFPTTSVKAKIPMDITLTQTIVLALCDAPLGTIIPRIRTVLQELSGNLKPLTPGAVTTQIKWIVANGQVSWFFYFMHIRGKRNC